MLIRNKYIERFNKCYVLFPDTNKKLHYNAAVESVFGTDDFVSAEDLVSLFQSGKLLIKTATGYVKPIACVPATTLTVYATVDTVETVSTAVAFVTYKTNES